jgi:hypothetical protein
MPRTRARLIASLLVLGALLIGGTAVAYRAIVERWGADPRGTLIAAAAVGISFFISMNLLLAWDERRRRRLTETRDGATATTIDGPQVADAPKKGP